MNKTFVCLFFITIAQFSYAIPPQELFLQGTKFFYDGDFKQAQDCFEQLPYRNATVWQNIGNCCYNQQDQARALICWKRAQKQATFNQLDQLFESERLILQTFDCPCDGIFMRGVKKIILTLPKLLLYVWLLVLLILFISLFYQCVMQSKDLKSLLPCKKGYFLLLIMSIVICMLLIAAKEKFTREKQGVLIHQKVMVYTGPESSFYQKMTLPEGYLVDVVDEDKSMYKISCPKGSGWILASDIEIV